jgi:hypothetical protein
MRGADLYAHETHLSKRVAEWQNRLEPLLEEQRQRRPFDIHEYGHEILYDVAAKLHSAKVGGSNDKVSCGRCGADATAAVLHL